MQEHLQAKHSRDIIIIKHYDNDNEESKAKTTLAKNQLDQIGIYTDIIR